MGTAFDLASSDAFIAASFNLLVAVIVACVVVTVLCRGNMLART